MLKDHISHHQVNELAKEAANSLQLVTSQRGLDYLRKGYVYNVVLTNSKIQATVQGSYKYLVYLDLNNFHQSRCSCPVQLRCKHIAATFLYLYAIYDRPENFLQYAAQDRRLPERKKTTPNPALLTPPGETSPAEEWYRYFEAEFNRFAKSNQREYQYGLYFYANFADAISRLARSWSAPLSYLYFFHARLFTMLQMEKNDDVHRSFYFMPDHGSNYFSQHISMLYHWAEKCNHNKVRLNHAAHFNPAVKILREMITLNKPEPKFNWLQIYRVLWSGFLNHLPWIKEEIQHLEQLLQENGLPPAPLYQATLARAHFTLIDGNDQAFMQSMEKVPQIKISDITPYLHAFEYRKEWERQAAWLRWLTPRMRHASPDEFEAICLYWTELAKLRQYQDEVLQALKSWLPKSWPFYSHSLVRAKQYKTWVNFHIFNQSLPAEIDRQEMHQVAASDLSMVLPLYHHFILRLILEKKRPAYQHAVRLLTKLQTYYKKLKRQDEWHRYITGLADRHSRLRAFREELRKGNLTL